MPAHPSERSFYRSNLRDRLGVHESFLCQVIEQLTIRPYSNDVPYITEGRHFQAIHFVWGQTRIKSLEDHTGGND